MERRRLEREARRARLVARATFSRQSVDPFDRYDTRPESALRREAACLTPQMRDLPTNNGIDPNSMSHGNAVRVAREVARRRAQGLSTTRQVSLLARYGYDASSMTKMEASQLIGMIAANGWRKPEAHG